MRHNVISKVTQGCILTAGLIISATTQAWNPKPVAQPQNNSPETAKIHFIGGLLTTPCALSVDSTYQQVDLGQISVKNFRNAGDRSPGVTFTLRFQDCLMGAHAYESDIGHSGYSDGNQFSTGEQIVSLTFTGNTVVFNPDLLKLNGAQGVGLRLSDSRGMQIPINKTMHNQYLNPGDNELRFSASLEATQKYVRADAFDAIVNINIHYF